MFVRTTGSANLRAGKSEPVSEALFDESAAIARDEELKSPVLVAAMDLARGGRMGVVISSPFLEARMVAIPFLTRWRPR